MEHVTLSSLWADDYVCDYDHTCYLSCDCDIQLVLAPATNLNKMVISSLCILTNNTQRLAKHPDAAIDCGAITMTGLQFMAALNT